MYKKVLCNCRVFHVKEHDKVYSLVSVLVSVSLCHTHTFRASPLFKVVDMQRTGTITFILFIKN